MTQHLGKILGGTFTALVVSLLVYLWVRDAAPLQSAVWLETPDAIVCIDDNLTQEDFDRAADFWQDQGHVLGTISYLQVLDCPADLTPGQILVQTGIPSQERLGETAVHHNDGTMIAAEITMLPFSWWENGPYRQDDYQILLAHELGHALGYEHLNQNGHVMAPTIERMGWGNEGVVL